MRQSEIEDEVWRNVNQIGFKVPDEYGQLVEKTLADDGLGFSVTAWFGPNVNELDTTHAAYFQTDGNPALEMYVIPWVDRKKIDVHVTRIGNSTVYADLEEKAVRSPA